MNKEEKPLKNEGSNTNSLENNENSAVDVVTQNDENIVTKKSKNLDSKKKKLIILISSAIACAIIIIILLCILIPSKSKSKPKNDITETQETDVEPSLEDPKDTENQGHEPSDEINEPSDEINESKKNFKISSLLYKSSKKEFIKTDLEGLPNKTRRLEENENVKEIKSEYLFTIV